MEELKKQTTDKRVWLGAILIILGGLFLLNSLEIFDFRFSRIFISWPFFFFIIGLYILFNTEKKILGAILSGLGGLFLLPRIFSWIHIDWSIVFPILLIAVGLYIILHRRKSLELRRSQIKEDTFDDISIFGGGDKIVTSKNFKGGNITAIFGGSEINMTQCELAEGVNAIDIFAMFGGTTIIVPKNWNVVVSVTSILGGFSNKGIKDPTVEIDTSRSLVIKGLVIFGGGEVKNF
ncbi:MAG: cell wall-active antibiotics response protein [Ignavibacteriaceae bacterium]|nr:cell wall-active antibiotics response protein [Ignavibacteriaceae bacterium]